MTTNKDFKRIVRTRMRKTGESYTTARAVLREKPSRRSRDLAAADSPEAAAVPAPDHATLAGMADATVATRTGRSWAEWVAVLDPAGAHGWSHRDIARFVHEKFDVPGWWAQTVSVGYERIKGLRDVGQRRDGGYEASRSRTIGVPAARVFRALTDARTRRRWLPDVKVKVRKATPDRSVRCVWEDGTPVTFWLTAKNADKASVTVTHGGLASREDVMRTKVYWGERLNALAELLAGK